MITANINSQNGCSSKKRNWIKILKWDCEDFQKWAWIPGILIYAPHYEELVRILMSDTFWKYGPLRKPFTSPTQKSITHFLEGLTRLEIKKKKTKAKTPQNNKQNYSFKLHCLLDMKYIMNYEINIFFKNVDYGHSNPSVIF